MPAIEYWLDLFVPTGTDGLAAGVAFGAVQSRLGRDWALQSNWPLPVGWLLALSVVVILSLIALELWRFGDRGAFSNERNQREHVGWRRWWLIGLRIATFLVVFWMLGRWELARYEVDLPDLLILVDRSQSMSMPLDRGSSTSEDFSAGDLTSRLDAAKEVLTNRSGNLLRELAEDYRLRVAAVDAISSPLSGDISLLTNELQGLQAEGDASRLGAALVEAVNGQRGRSTAGIILISDGVVTDGLGLSQAAEVAAAARLPIFAVKTGSEYPPPNIEIQELLADSAAMVGDRVRVVARVRWESSGQDWADPNRVTVRMLDGESGRVLSEQELTMNDGRGSEQVELLFTATDAGLRRMKVEVGQLSGEVNVVDNVSETTVDIRDQSFRVLLVQGAASYEFRFLKHLLERATNRDGSKQLVELISVLQSGDPRYADQDRAARRLPPVDDETLEKLDLIILSDCDPLGLGRVLQNRIVDLVTGKGTSLIVIAGPDHLPGKLAGTPLESLLPVDLNSVAAPNASQQGLNWELTSLGNSVASLQIADAGRAWKDVPPLYWLARATRLRPGARVMLETAQPASNGQRLPILVNQLAGNGQVWLQLTDESFRLRVADLNAELYERYWLQMVRSLAQGRQVVAVDEADLEVYGERFFAGSPIPFEVRLGTQLAAVAGGQVTIAVTDEAGRTEIFKGEVDSAGKGYRGLIQNLPAGTYRAVLASPLGAGDPANDEFVITSSNRELTKTAVDLAAMEDLATLTGGALLDVGDVANELRSLLPAGRALRVRALEPVVIWNHWLVCSLLFGLLSAQWILRRRFRGL